MSHLLSDGFRGTRKGGTHPLNFEEQNIFLQFLLITIIIIIIVIIIIIIKWIVGTKCFVTAGFDITEFFGSESEFFEYFCSNTLE